MWEQEEDGAVAGAEAGQMAVARAALRCVSSALLFYMQLRIFGLLLCPLWQP